MKENVDFTVRKLSYFINLHNYHNLFEDKNRHIIWTEINSYYNKVKLFLLTQLKCQCSVLCHKNISR